MALTPKDISARSTVSANKEAGTPDSVLCECSSPFLVKANYDDLWKTPVTNANIGITSQNKGIIYSGTEGEPTTLGLINFGAQDGEKRVPQFHPQLGTFNFPSIPNDAITTTLEPTPNIVQTIKALENEIIAMLNNFRKSIESNLTPWIKEYESSPIFGTIEAYNRGYTNGVNAWYEDEIGFWDSLSDSAVNTAKWVWENPEILLNGIPVIGAINASRQLGGYAQAIWENKDIITELVKAFANESINDIENLLQSLLNSLKNITNTADDLLTELIDILESLISNSVEWISGLIETMKQTDVVSAYFKTLWGVILIIPPTFLAEMVSSVQGYILPEVLISIIFAIIAFFTAGTGAGLLATRIATFIARVTSKLKSAGKAGKIILDVFEVIQRLSKKFIELVKAVKQNVSEFVEETTERIITITRRSGKRITPAAELPCFNYPKSTKGKTPKEIENMNKEFERQLKEQETAINNTYLTDLKDRRDLVKRYGTKKIREDALKIDNVQQKTRKFYQRKRTNELRQTMSLAEAKKIVDIEIAALAATHVLDIIAGGNPLEVSGLGDKGVNSSIGKQWTLKGRVQALDTAISNQIREGGVKANIILKICS